MGAQERNEMSNESRETPKDQLNYSSLCLAAGHYPFSLAKNEQLSGDQWAWRFLRLNPYYRYDYQLRLKKRPKALQKFAGPIGEARADLVKTKDFLDLDSRYFLFKGETATAPLSWPNIKRLTLKEYLLGCGITLDEFDYRQLKIRRLLPSIYYGISYWFDPDVVELPKLGPNQSWFFNERKVPWRVGDRRIVRPKRQTILYGPPRMAPHIDREAAYSKHKAQIEGIEDPTLLSFLLGSLDSSKARWDEGSTIEIGESSDICRDDKLDEADRRRKLGEIISPHKEHQLTYDSGFSRKTEIVFLLDLNRRLEYQIAHMGRIATSFQKLLQREGLSKKLPVAPPGFQPLAFHPDRIAGSSANSVFLNFVLSRTCERSNRENHRMVILDVAFSLPSQIRRIEEQLDDEQKHIDSLLKSQGKKGLIGRQKTGRAVKGGDHWLKRALILLELHITLAAKNSERCLSAEKLCRAVYDKTDGSFYPLLTRESIPSVKNDARTALKDAPLSDDDIHTKTETIKDALEVAKELALEEYLFLLGD